jgi:hypothetical protein
MLALAHFGDDTHISSLDPPDATLQAEKCAQFYPVARDLMLAKHPATFNTKTEKLTALNHVVDGFDYCYAAPSGMLTPLSLWVEGSAPLADKPENAVFRVEVGPLGQEVILTNLPSAVLRYSFKITDTAKFSPLFVEALSWLLASMIAGPIVKGDAGGKISLECYRAFLSRVSETETDDANKSRPYIDPVAPWLEVRA